MYAINVDNVNRALYAGIVHLLNMGEREQSRNGEVLVARNPVMTIYDKPTERVLFSPLRDANPFFHLMESLWMIAGRNDVEFPTKFNSKFKEYSDDGLTVHGAYGHRWRKHFGYDQLRLIALDLRRNPNSRRAVLQMWDASPADYNGAGDLPLAISGGKDVPCNTHIYFDVRGGRLNMTVCCRSNDIIWGAYGANAVHMSILQEYLAAALKVEVGVYRQFSNNFHMYTELYGHTPEKLLDIAEQSNKMNLYRTFVKPSRLINTDIETWDNDLVKFMLQPANDLRYEDEFFTHTAQPMYDAWIDRKSSLGDGMRYAETIGAQDWREACTDWIRRRNPIGG